MDGMADMTGPEHFRAGEKRLSRSEEYPWHTPEGRETAAVLAQQASAHFAASQASAWALLAASEAAVDIVGPAKVWAELFGIDTETNRPGVDELVELDDVVGYKAGGE